MVSDSGGSTDAIVGRNKIVVVRLVILLLPKSFGMVDIKMVNTDKLLICSDITWLDYYLYI